MPCRWAVMAIKTNRTAEGVEVIDSPNAMDVLGGLLLASAMLIRFVPSVGFSSNPIKMGFAVLWMVGALMRRDVSINKDRQISTRAYLFGFIPMREFKSALTGVHVQQSNANRTPVVQFITSSRTIPLFVPSEHLYPLVDAGVIDEAEVVQLKTVRAFDQVKSKLIFALLLFFLGNVGGLLRQAKSPVRSVSVQPSQPQAPVEKVALSLANS
jgi:hypothetical protein